MTLRPINQDFDPIVLTPADELDIQIIGEFVSVLSRATNQAATA